MSATEDDSELRGLLIQTLENNGVLNKLKAEMRAAVFLAMDEQARVENKTPLVNENLKKCLNTQDGCLVASLIIDFLQVFHIDFTLAVFQPEINSLNGLGSREQVSRDLGITETDMNRTTPLLLELVKRGRHREKASIFSAELSPRQIADARQKFDSYDKDRTDGICKEDLEALLGDVFPNFNKNMLERFVTDELRAGDKASTSDFQEFLGLYKRFFSQCRSVITHDTSDVIHNPSRYVEKMSPSPASKIPRFKGHKNSAQEEKAGTKGEKVSHSDTSLNFVSLKGKGQGHLVSRHSETSGSNGNAPVASQKKRLEVEEDADEGDSFFDDPLPKPQKTYGCSVPLTKSKSGPSLSNKKNSQKERAAGLDREVGSSTLASLLDPATQWNAAGGWSHSGESHHRDLSGSRNDDDVDYDDDFNSHRSDISKSEVSIGEEIEEVSVKGPDNSNKFDEITQDLSVSQLSQTQGAD
ncbi:centrosomal protein 43-like isoform X5 [Salmo salar]|uniref:Centrosomal protein 43-like isoform X5 n=1 Tax=Salmo salar TaxID=8030 RepID=A0ABM3F112_SALSA|nr:centrosomal protein 43-like isoform X5 [Salmo salar]XP_045577009.1 centrosomal protein 43-like isoform X5 [Salmo salar]